MSAIRPRKMVKEKPQLVKDSLENSFLLSIMRGLFEYTLTYHRIHFSLVNENLSAACTAYLPKRPSSADKIS